MPNKATDWLFGRASQAVVAAMLGVATGLWQKFAKASTWPEVIVVGLVTFVCLFWLAEKFWHFPLRWRVRQWLDDTGFNVKTVESQGEEFRFVMTDHLGVKTLISQSRPNAPLRICVAGISPTQAVKDIFSGWPVERKAEFWRQVRMEFMRYGVEFSDLKMDGEGVSLSTSLMPSSTMTSLDFTGAVLHVRSGARLYLEYLAMIRPEVQQSLPHSTHDHSRLLPSQA